MNEEDERLLAVAGHSRNEPRDSVVEVNPMGEEVSEEEERETARKRAAEEEERNERERREEEEANRAKAEKARLEKERADKKREDKARAEKEKADKADKARAEKEKARMEKARAEKTKNSNAMSDIKRRLAELQAKLDGNRLAAASPPRSTSPVRTRTRQDRMSSKDFEEEEYRDNRYRSERDRRERFRSESPRNRRALSPYTVLGVEGRPAGMSRERINALGVENAIHMKGWQREDESRKAAELGRPGKRILETSKPRPLVEVKAMMGEEADNGSTRLSAARFLRPPESATSWWKKVPMGWEEGEGQHWSDYNGTRDSMPSGTFHSRAERDIYLPSKFWAKKNHLADARDLREHLSSAGNGSAVRTIGSSKKYKEINEFNELISALVNFAAANRELWPWDQVRFQNMVGTRC